MVYLLTQTDCAKKFCVSVGICILFERNFRIHAFAGCALNETARNGVNVGFSAVSGFKKCLGVWIQ
jgi:hypothetical protein